jgi:hypothetical protein
LFFYKVGYSQQQFGTFNKWRARLEACNVPYEPQPVKKVPFAPKCQLETLPDYKCKFPDAFWATCVGKRAAKEGLLNTEGIREAAAGIPSIDGDRLGRVLQRAEKGADIDCREYFRAPTFSSNAPDAYENGRQVSDAVGVWLRKGLVTGPVQEDDLPAGAKVSGIMTRTKPDGSVRIILNLSAPTGLSVNDGIDADQCPAIMSSTDQWLSVLNKAGRGCWMSKTDWADAYKHIEVREEDKDLQWFWWGGQFFREERLIFGSASSAGIFDDAAKIILHIVCHEANFPRAATCQHLDDIVAAHLDRERIIELDEDALTRLPLSQTTCQRLISGKPETGRIVWT